MFKVTELTRIYHTGGVELRALDGISFVLPEGDMLAIMGRSGSGKSTLLRQLGLLDRPTSGEVVFGDKAVTGLSEVARAKLRLGSMGYVFQEYALLGELTAYQNVYLPGMMAGDKQNNYQARARELLDLVGLGKRLEHYPKELSGGEQQRVAIARALINRPKVLLADEPCANLDTVSSQSVMETLVRLNKDLGVTILLVSHDPADRKYARSLIVLSDGKVVERG